MTTSIQTRPAGYRNGLPVKFYVWHGTPPKPRPKTPPPPTNPARPGGWLIAWGDQVDVRVITMRGGNAVTDAMVAAYLAKYSTKGTEATGHASARITDDTIDLYASADGSHAERLIYSCWILGGADGVMFGKTHGWDSLRRWAHMLGFGGHFLTKGRRYSVTFGALRSVRVFYRRNETTGPEHDPMRTADHVEEEATLIIGNLWYAGTGWKTTGDALLANTAADQARRRREAGPRGPGRRARQPG